MTHLARRHPIATFLVVLILSPYILALAVVYIAVFAIAAALDLLAGR